MFGVLPLVGVCSLIGAVASWPGPEIVLSGALPFDVATAPAERFTLLPEIGRVLAERVVSTRRSSGGFESIDDLLRVPGIGPRTIDAIRWRLDASGATRPWP